MASQAADRGDRYVSFLGLDCDAKAEAMMGMLSGAMRTSSSQWVGYFEQKLAENQKMGRDSLYFVGSQVNALSAFFEEEGDEAALSLLAELEDKCC
ncbi:N(2)-fixation sustaining protein CowN [Afifella aestuarii]|uniref:N(2)-fixation sustaining protein CowN n=1 Tax=Afifella aestuarii TaxID=1909496 RepID=UPI000FE410D3|nr:N(2)-fixation sustaining protein CowN [Afifella aestuarii]